MYVRSIWNEMIPTVIYLPSQVFFNQKYLPSPAEVKKKKKKKKEREREKERKNNLAGSYVLYCRYRGRGTDRGLVLFWGRMDGMHMSRGGCLFVQPYLLCRYVPIKYTTSTLQVGTHSAVMQVHIV